MGILAVMQSRLFFKTETNTKTFIFVLEAPRDQDAGLEDYITAFWLYS